MELDIFKLFPEFVPALKVRMIADLILFFRKTIHFSGGELPQL
jgi:hypothetical protein